MRYFKYKIAIFLLLAASCSQKGLDTYSGTENVYFNYVPTVAGSQIDTALISFGLTQPGITDSIIHIPVYSMGDLVNHDRSFKIKVEDSSTAVAGVHYEALPDTFKIKAGKVYDYVTVKLLRASDLQTKSVMLSLTLQPNENFNTDLKKRITNSITGAYISYVNFRIKLNDMLPKPQYWLDTYMGAFSRKKIYVMSTALGMDIGTMYQNFSNISYQVYMGRTTQIYLNTQKAAGNTIYEEDGITPMAMGVSVQ